MRELADENTNGILEIIEEVGAMSVSFRFFPEACLERIIERGLSKRGSFLS
jgi:hypothetical protein